MNFVLKACLIFADFKKVAYFVAETLTLMDTPDLTQLIEVKMPFGKYKGTPIYALPEAYLLWFHRKGFPKGKIGTLLALMYEIRLNGLEYLLKPLKPD